MVFFPELDKPKPIAPQQAAKILSEAAGWTLSNLQIHKILYLAQMTYMHRNGGAPLIGGSFQAWDYGPVLPSLYHDLKCFGDKPVQNVFRSVPTGSVSDEQKSILRSAARKFKDASPGYLVRLTHLPDGAWSKNYDASSRYVAIPERDILEEAKRRYGQTTGGGAV